MSQKDLDLPKGIHDYDVVTSRKMLSLIEILRNIGRKFGYQEVILSSLNYADTANHMQASVGRRYDFLDKKSRELCLSVDSSLALLRGLGAKILEEGHLCTLHRVFRYQNAPYRSWYQYCYGIYGNYGDAYSDTEILSLIIDIINETNLKNVRIYINEYNILYSMFESYFPSMEEFKSFLLMYRFGFDETKYNQVISKFSPEDKNFFHHLTQNTYTYEGLKTLINKRAKNKNFGTTFEVLDYMFKSNHMFDKLFLYDFSKFKSTDVYDGLMYQVWDTDKKLLLIEGGRYNDFSSNVTKKIISKAASVCIGIDLLAKEYQIPIHPTVKIYCYFYKNTSHVCIEKLNRFFSKYFEQNIFLCPDAFSKKITNAKKRAILNEYDWFLVIGENEIQSGTVVLEGIRSENENEKLKIKDTFKNNFVRY